MKIYHYFFLFFFLFTSSNVLGYTRENVLQRDLLRCGVSPSAPGFATKDADGRWQGFDVDICRAVAAAVLGDAEMVEFVPLRVKGAYTALLSGKIDVLLLHQPGGEWDFTRDSALAVNFVWPSFFDETALITSIAKAKSVDKLAAQSCVPTKQKESYTQFLLKHKVKGESVFFATEALAAKGFSEGSCNLFFWPRSLVQQIPQGGIRVVLPEIFDRIVFGPIVRQGDDNWFNIIRWSLFAIIDAEALGFSSKNAQEMRLSDRIEVKRFFGYEGSGGKGVGLASDWAAQIIMQVGNYGEIFARNLGKDSPLKMERGKNRIWSEGGLHYAPPLK